MENESVKSEQSGRSRRSRSHNNSGGGGEGNRTVQKMEEDRYEGQEIIEVQILPQDENWGENTTAITGNTSEQSAFLEDGRIALLNFRSPRDITTHMRRQNCNNAQNLVNIID
uniref:Uncharacterized protein n=1 Tax=Glossina pallidipes TaxID=7398 RepID=A0A1A9ZB55_GLOPL